MFGNAKARGKAAAPPPLEKPLPDPSGSSSPPGSPSGPAQRPGTSGTEMLLMTNRRQASEQLQRAQRAERTYVAKKRSAAARSDYAAAKVHFGEGLRHLKAGFGLTWAVIKGSPYLLKQRREETRKKSDQKKRQAYMEKKKRLEEALARESAEAPAEGADAANEKEKETA